MPEVMQVGVVDELLRAREAFDRRDWLAAYDALSAVRDDALLAADFADLATAAFLVGRHNDCVHALDRAYQAHLAAGDVGAAVRCAFWLAMTLQDRGEAAVAGGWISRAQRLLEDVDGDTAEHGYVRFTLMLRDIFAGRIEQALEGAVAVTDYGRRYREPDLVAAGLMSQGRCLVYSGQGPGRPRAAGRVDGPGRRGRGLAGLRRPGLLLGDRGLPGGRGLRPGRGVDRGADDVERRAARAAALHRPVRAPPRPGDAGPRRAARGGARARAGRRAVRRLRVDAAGRARPGRAR